MRPCTFLVGDARDSVASLAVGVGNSSGKGGTVTSDFVTVIGASMSVSINTRNDHEVRSFSLELINKEERGVVAVKVKDTKGWTTALLVGVRKENEKVKLLMSDVFVPEPGRLGQIDNDGRITVKVEDTIFTNEYPSNFYNPHPVYKLADADNLCRYMVGLVDKDGLETASMEHINQLTKDEKIASLQTMKGRLENVILDGEVENNQLMVEVARLKEERQKLNELVEVYRKANKAIEELSSDFVIADTKWFCQAEAFRIILRRFFGKVNVSEAN